MSYQTRTRKMRSWRTDYLLDVLELIIEDAHPEHEQARADIRNVILERVQDPLWVEPPLPEPRIPELFAHLRAWGT